MERKIAKKENLLVVFRDLYGINNNFVTSKHKNTMDRTYVIGVDYGTDSVRALLIDVRTGEELAAAVSEYARWNRGLYCDAARLQFRQHPLDYLEGLEQVLREVVRQCPEPGVVRAIAVDTTGSTPCLVDEQCMPLALKPGFEENPAAMFVLWKDHTAGREAERINAHVTAEKAPYTLYTGGCYSSEWFWAKALRLLNEDPSLRGAAWAPVELCDWIPAVLTGCRSVGALRQGRCSAGHKAMWARQWGGFPPASFFAPLDPELVHFAERLNPETYTCDQAAGTLCAEWAAKVGLPVGVAIGVGNTDAHAGAVGAGIRYKTLVQNIGTSTCNMVVMPPERVGDRIVDGICGQVEGSILPGMIGFEAGMSAFGDIYAWFRKLLCWPLREILAGSTVVDAATRERLICEVSGQILPRLTAEAEKLDVASLPLTAVDWLNGRRNPCTDYALRGGVMGLGLSTSAPEIFFALAEATAFGCKAIVDHFLNGGVEIGEVVAIGGISQKSPFVMQLLADVMGMEIRVPDCGQACALGSAMYAATVAGVYPAVEQAQMAMARPLLRVYRPDAVRGRILAERYERYRALGLFATRLTQSQTD